MNLIVAVNNLGYIGKGGKMMWRCKADQLHFKEKTWNKLCLVGRVTLEGMPALKNRRFLLVSNSTDPGTARYNLQQALLQQADWVIGGASIYAQTVHHCEEIHISHIDNDDVGDTKFEIPEDYKGKVVHYYFKPD